MQKPEDKKEEILKSRREQYWLTVLGITMLVGGGFYLLQPEISLTFYPQEVKEAYKTIEKVEKKLSSGELELTDRQLRNFYEYKHFIETEYPLRPTFKDLLVSLEKKNWRVFFNALFQVGGVIALFVGFFLYYKRKVLSFFFQEGIKEPPIEYGAFDPKLFQPEKWGVSKKDFLSVFNGKEAYEKFVRTITKRLKKRVELFEGGYKEFNPDEINALIGKILNLIEERGVALTGVELSSEDRKLFRISVGLALFHHILFNFGHVPSGTLSIFLKDKVVKKVLTEYPKGQTLVPDNEVFKKAGDFLTLLHTARVNPTDFPDDFEIFSSAGAPELSVLEFLSRKFKTLPD